MFKFRISTASQLAAMLGCVLAVACSSGGSSTIGGTGGGTTTTGGGSATTGGGTGSTGGSTGGTDTGIAAGTVAAPAPATFGSAAAQLATPGGPTFDGSSGSYAANATFPMIVSSLQSSSTGLSAVSGNGGASATVVNTSASSSTLQLTIPALGINGVTLAFHTNLVSHLGQLTDGLSYVVMGAWQQAASALQNFTVFVFGYETPQSAMPASGTAAFSGTAAAYVYKAGSPDIQASGYVEGNASVSVNFGSGAVTGNFTKMQTLTSQPWNDVSVTGSITPGTNRISGSTAATSSPGNSASLSTTATGHIDGAFYGPAAQNLGAAWSLSDGTGSALGTVVVGH